MEVNIMDYLSEGEIRECIKEELKKQISNYINKVGVDTFISNISYINVFKKIDEEIPDFEIQIKEKVKNIIENLSDYCVFKEKSIFEKESVGQKLLNNAVEENKNILNEKVIEIYKGLSKQDIATEICGILEEKIENMFKGE